MQIEPSELINLVCAIKSAPAEVGSASNAAPVAPASGVSLGQRIVVLDRGFVYVGDVTEYPDRITIANARNIRVWGTTRGLGELVAGPLSGTKLDTVGAVECYRHAVIHLIACKGF